MPTATREERGQSKSRLLKIECPTCGMILRGSSAALRLGLPTCACGEMFEIPAPASLEKVDPDAYEQLYTSVSGKAANQIMRLQGYELVALHGRHRTPQCKARGCKRTRASLSLYCVECDPAGLPF